MIFWLMYRNHCNKTLELAKIEMWGNVKFYGTNYAI